MCGSGSVNIRVGNDTKYGRITSVKDGTTFEWVATAENGWHAILVNAQIGWGVRQVFCNRLKKIDKDLQLIDSHAADLNTL